MGNLTQGFNIKIESQEELWISSLKLQLGIEQLLLVLTFLITPSHKYAASELTMTLSLHVLYCRDNLHTCGRNTCCFLLFQEKEEFIKTKLAEININKSPTEMSTRLKAEELSEFYKNFLDKHYKMHKQYNM